MFISNLVLHSTYLTNYNDKVVYMEQKENKKLSFDAKSITNLGLLMALQIILARFLSIQTPIVRISFGFLPLALIGILYGPWVGGVCGVISDFIGLALFPSGPYFPGFTLTVFLSGFTYGFLLYNNQKSWQRILLANIIVCLLLNLALNTLWLSILMGKGYLALLPPRIIKSVAMIPVQFITISLVWNKFISKLNLIQFSR